MTTLPQWLNTDQVRVINAARAAKRSRTRFVAQWSQRQGDYPVSYDTVYGRMLALCRRTFSDAFDVLTNSSISAHDIGRIVDYIDDR